MTKNKRRKKFNLKKFISKIKNRVKLIVSYIKPMIVKFGDDFGFQRAGSLAYSTLISLVPIATLFLSLFSSLKFFQNSQEAIKGQVFKHLVPAQAEAIQGYIEEFSKNLSSLNTVSIVVFLLLGIFLLVNLENHLNAIWKVKAKRNFFYSLASYWTVLTLGPLLIGVSFYITNNIGVFGLVENSRFLALAFSFFMNLIFMFLIYFMMPNLSVRFKGAFWGAVFAGFFYELVKNLFTGFTSQLFDAQFQIYESLALLPLFLLWIFIVWVIILIGAEIAYFIQFPPILDEAKINANKTFTEDLAVFLVITKLYLDEAKQVDKRAIHKMLLDLKPYELDSAVETLLKLKLILETDERGYIPYSDPSKQSFANIIVLLLGIEDTVAVSKTMKDIVKRLQGRIKREFKDDIVAMCDGWK